MFTPLPIGSSDFAQIRREGQIYIDKSPLITDIVRAHRRVLLLPRPRRFGKTLNLTMLRAFFERAPEDHWPLFEDLQVAQAGDDVLSHFRRHATIYLTFKDVKAATWAECAELLTLTLRDELARLHPVWREAPLEPAALEPLARLLDGEQSLAAWSQLLRRLSQALAAATGEPVVILIDEYDTPIHAGFAGDFYEPAVGFFRNFLSAGLKDNPHLYRGVITGILRVARESIFSGLNNVDAHTVLSPQFTEHFGFTEEEVASLAERAGQAQLLPTLQQWYNGYRIGPREIYNPWSVLSQLARPGSPPQAWWVNTASDEILRELLIGAGLGVQDDLAALLRGESISRPIQEELVLRDVRQNRDALWSFLLFSGYLTAEDPLSRDADGRPNSPLRIPNREVATLYRGLFQGWLQRSLHAWSDAPQRLARALLEGDEETFRALLGRLMLASLSFHDLGGRRPEAVYQAFIVGLLVLLEPTHEVRSNRESGFGRYDLLIRPRTPGGPGAVIELKVLDEESGETPEVALRRAMTQIADRDYAADLREAGAAPIWRWAAVFDGKRAWVQVEPEAAPA